MGNGKHLRMKFALVVGFDIGKLNTGNNCILSNFVNHRGTVKGRMAALTEKEIFEIVYC